MMSEYSIVIVSSVVISLLIGLIHYKYSARKVIEDLDELTESIFGNNELKTK